MTVASTKFYGTGRRKKSIARVYLVPGTGNITINKRTIDEYGGDMSGAMGVPEEMLRQAASMAVCKINVDSDLRMAFTAAVRKHFALNPAHFDPRQYLGDARSAITEIVRHKIEDVLGSNGQA